jgi:hypothetical protein
LPQRLRQGMIALMNQYRLMHIRVLSAFCALLLSYSAPGRAYAEPTPAALSAFNAYVSTVEARLSRQHLSRSTFLAPPASTPQGELSLRRGEPLIEQVSEPMSGQLTTSTRVDLPAMRMPGAMLHHWRGTAFIPGAKAADFERILKDFNAYPQRFSPEVLQARVLTQQGDRLQASMRVRQKHVLTVVMDTTYDIAFGRLDPQHGYSASRSTRIREIDAPGTDQEHALNTSEEHGFLWRLNTYWSYEERDDGLYIQIESVSLSRSIPTGLGWALRPFVESVPRESLEFTLRSTSNAVHR